MSFVRLGGRTLAYGRGERSRDEQAPADVDSTAAEHTIRKEIEALKSSNGELQAEIDALKRDKETRGRKVQGPRRAPRLRFAGSLTTVLELSLTLGGECTDARSTHLV